LAISILFLGFPCLLENPGSKLFISLIYFSIISRTWKVLENDIAAGNESVGPGKSWSLIVVQINRCA